VKKAGISMQCTRVLSLHTGISGVTEADPSFLPFVVFIFQSTCFDIQRSGVSKCKTESDVEDTFRGHVGALLYRHNKGRIQLMTIERQSSTFSYPGH